MSDINEFNAPENNDEHPVEDETLTAEDGASEETAADEQDSRESSVKLLTGYGVWKIANTMLIARSLPEIKPQFVYSYIKQGMIKPTVQRNNQTLVAYDVAYRWATKYCTNKAARINEASAIERLTTTEENDEEHHQASA
jgi:hypothetical protein